MRIIYYALSCFILMGCTMDRLGVKVDAKTPYRMNNTTTKSISVTEITNGVQYNTIIGKGYGGDLCLYVEDIRWIASPYIGSTLTDFVREELEYNGYQILGKAHSPFKEEYKKRAEYLLGGKIIDVKSNICKDRQYIKGEFYIKVGWEIYDKSSDKIILLPMTEGYAETNEFNNLGDKYIIDKAFKVAIKNLLADKTFYELIKIK